MPTSKKEAGVANRGEMCYNTYVINSSPRALNKARVGIRIHPDSNRRKLT